MTSASQDFEKTRNEEMTKKPVKSNEGLSIEMPGNKGVANTRGENDGWVTKTPGMDDQPKSGLKLSALIFAGVSFVLVTIAAASSTMGAVSSANKDMHVRHDGTHHPMATDGKGNVLQTGSPATYEVALYVATVIPDDVLFKVGELRVTLPNIEFDANAVYSYHISSVMKVNSTVLVFYAVGGEEIRLVNGVSTVRLSANGMDIPVCSANVTCAAFEVDSSALAAKYTAEADALLAPFVARRRLEGNDDEGYEDNTVCADLNGESYMKCLAKKCLRNARKAKKAAEAAEVALTGTGTGDGEGGLVETINAILSNQADMEMVQGGMVEKQLAMDEKLNTLISNQANMEMVQGGLVNTVNTLSLALSRMEGKLQTVDTTVQTINSTVQNILAPSAQNIDTTVQTIDSTVQTIDTTVQTIDTSVSLLYGSVQDLFDLH